MIDEALFAAVYAAPDDPDARGALAAKLCEKGDPRGELIRLQCLERRTKAEEARVADLLTAHRAAWLGKLAGVFAAELCVFERGFLSVAALLPFAPTHPELADDPTWATVREVRTADHGGEWEPLAFPLLVSPHARSLRAVRYIPERAFFRMTSGEGRKPLESLGVRIGDLQRAREALPRTTDAFSGLRELVVLSIERDMPVARYADLLASLPPVERAGVHGPALLRLAEWRDAIRSTPFLWFELAFQTLCFTLRRASQAEPFTDVTIMLPTRSGGFADLPEAARVALETLPVGALARVVVELRGEGRFSPKRRRLLEDTLRRFPDAEIVLPW